MFAFLKYIFAIIVLPCKKSMIFTSRSFIINLNIVEYLATFLYDMHYLAMTEQKYFINIASYFKMTILHFKQCMKISCSNKSLKISLTVKV